MKLSRSLIPDAAALQAFEAAARHQSFTRAALELDLTQSAISRQIKDLEAKLGLQLFDRVRQRVVLSGAGRRLLPEVERLLAQIETMTLRAIGTRDISGQLTVATLPTFGSRWLMPRLPRFLALHPGVQLTVVSRSEPFDLEAAAVDLAIHYGRPVWPKAVCTYLCSEDVVPVGSPTLVSRFRQSGGADVAALAAMPLLHMESRPTLWFEWLAAQGTEPRLGFRGHRFDQFSLIIEAAAAGLGLALVPRYLIGQELERGRLLVVLDLPLRTEPNYYVVQPEGRTADALPAAFRDWLGEQVGRGQPTIQAAS